MAVLRNHFSNVLLTVLLCLITSPLFAATPVQQARYQDKVLTIDGGQMHFFDIGKGQPIVMIHGLLANKEQWIGILNHLQQLQPNILQHYRFIVPDLAGYGQSLGFPIGVYNITALNHEHLSQIIVLHDLLQQLHVSTRIHLAGNSMGGLIMALYAKKYPQEIKSIAFVGSPQGITMLSKTLVRDSIRKGFNPFIPTTLAQFTTETKLLAYSYKNITPSTQDINNKILPWVKAHFQLLSTIVNMVNTWPYMFALKTPVQLKTPILIFWGTNDHIFGKPFHAYELASSFVAAPYRKVVILQHAGHLVLMENNEVLSKVAKIYYQFLQRKCSTPLSK